MPPGAHVRFAEHQRRPLDLVTNLLERQCARYGITPAAPPEELAALLLAGETGIAQLGLADPTSPLQDSAGTLSS